MTRFVLIRLVWLLPALLVVLVLGFWALTPRPSGGALPVLFNPYPVDVRERTETAMDEIARGDESRGAAELLRLGGASLPHGIPRLDLYNKDARGRIAAAWGPLAERMGLPLSERAHDPEQAPAYWRRYWDDHSADFEETSVRTAALRLARYQTKSRAEGVRAFDTYAVPSLGALLPSRVTTESFESTRVLIDALAHATAVDRTIDPTDSLEVAQSTLDFWQAYLADESSRWMTFPEGGRWFASIAETQFSKWLGRQARRGLPVDRGDVLALLRTLGLSSLVWAAWALARYLITRTSLQTSAIEIRETWSLCLGVACLLELTGSFQGLLFVVRRAAESTEPTKALLLVMTVLVISTCTRATSDWAIES